MEDHELLDLSDLEQSGLGVLKGQPQGSGLCWGGNYEGHKRHSESLFHHNRMGETKKTPYHPAVCFSVPLRDLCRDQGLLPLLGKEQGKHSVGQGRLS